MSEPGPDLLLEQLNDRFRSLEQHCLTDFEAALSASRDGDLSRTITPVTRPVDAYSDNPIVTELGRTFNSALDRVQASITAYNELFAHMRNLFGEHSTLSQVIAGVDSLNSHCMPDLKDGLAAMAAGNLTHTITPVTQPVTTKAGLSIGQLGEAFNVLLGMAQDAIGSYDDGRGRIAEMIREIQTTSVSVASASTQMAASSDETGRAIGEIAHAVSDVAQGAERQVRSVDDAKLLAVEVVAASNTSADNAQSTAQAAAHARELAQQGSAAVAKATETMEAVRDTSNEAAIVIRALGEKSAHIGGIVDTISGIAQQTNLLALNAAIEAARAGEQGRGFAVVADEVRKLAEGSQAAAADIGSLIREIQKETTRAVEVVETGAKRTEEGVGVVARAQESFAEITDSVDDMTSRVDQIAAAVQQIASSSHRMQQSMDDVASLAEQSSASTEEVSASTEQTSASAQEIAASAQQLSTTAEQLERLVNQFTL